jgi:hypothetical protein
MEQFTDNFLDRIERMGRAIRPYAKARAERVYVENFLRSKKALLMQQAPEDCTTIGAKEMFAYSHPEYISLLKSLKAAVEIEETTRWALEKFKIEFEAWRTENANQRWQRDKV